MENLPLFQAGLYFCEPTRQGFLNLAIGETQYGMSPLAQQALLRAAQRGDLPYPDSSARELIEKIAAHHRVEPDMVFIGNGTDEVILSAALAFLQPKDPCLLSRSTFAGFEASAKLVHAELLYSPLKQMRVDGESLLDLLRQGPRLWFLCNPHNPTGSVLSFLEQEALFEAAHQYGVVTLVDEAYAEYADPQEFTSAIEWVNRYPNLLVTRTFSKIYGLGGLRCGYAIGNKDLIAKLKRSRHAVPFNVNRIALEVASAALDDQTFAQECYRRTQQAKSFFCQRLQEMGFICFPSSTNFVFAEFSEETDAICETLQKEYQILVRSGRPFGLPRCIRITLGTLEQMQYVAGCLEKVCCAQPLF